MRETISSWWKPTVAASARAVIAPYGALTDTGELCADVFSRVAVPDTVVLLGASNRHRMDTDDGRVQQPAIASTGRWRLPGHTVSVDTSMAEELRDVGLLREDVALHHQEMCLEAQLPFLVHARPDIRIVPVCFGELGSKSCIRIGHALADVIARNGGHALVVVSASLTAAPTEPLSVDLLAEIATFDIAALAARVDADSGAQFSSELAPTLTALVASAALGAASVEQVHRSLQSRVGVILR